MRRTREEKAITLIALIITIVVLLILAVVAINAVTGDGIIQHAVNAKTEYEKAQDAEEDMLAYYEGVLQSGEVVPTVEQLQEKYTFSYFSSLKRAIENANGTANIEADSTEENAVAGIYENDNEDKYVVLMKDTEESSILSVTSDITINLGGKTLSFTGNGSYLNFGENTDCTIDGRLGGSTIQKSIEDSTGYGIIFSNGKNLTINSGKYIMDGKYSLRFFAIESNNKENFEINNAKIIINNNADVADKGGAILVRNSENINAKINNCNINIQFIAGIVIPVRCITGHTNINNSYIYGASDNQVVRGVIIDDNAEVIINNTDIFTDSADSNANLGSWGIANQGGRLKFYSGNVIGTFVGLYSFEGAESYVYGGTLSGYGGGGFVTYQGESGKAYLENTTIMTGAYTGKYDASQFARHNNQAITIGDSTDGFGSNIDVYIDNCKVIGANESSVSIVLTSDYGSTSGNNVYISNSEITGTISLGSGNIVNLGENMNKDEFTITGEGTINDTDESYRGMDKTLMEGN